MGGSILGYFGEDGMILCWLIALGERIVDTYRRLQSDRGFLMNYWCMKLLHQDVDWRGEQRLLKQQGFIGLGEYSGTPNQRLQFKKQLLIGDIVLILRNFNPIALVEVTSDYYYVNNSQNFSYFTHRRNIKILAFSQSNYPKTVPVRPLLLKSTGKKTKVYRTIDAWVNKIEQKKYIQSQLTLNDYKIKSFNIVQYRVLSNLHIDLVDKNNIPLPIVVIAGKNGMGKTSILEFLADGELADNEIISIHKTRKPHKSEVFISDYPIIVEENRIENTITGINRIKKIYHKNLIYLPVGINMINQLEMMIIKHINTMLRLHEKRMKEIIADLQEKIEKLFTGFDLSFNFSHITIDDQIFFKNKYGEEFPSENLSTGEKTLLSKVLYLSLKNVNNKIILIDEPELSLHPMWQEKVLAIYEKFAKDNNNQIIIATHSPHIIGSAKNESIRVLRDINGKIEVINDVTAYGRDIKWVLKEVMGSEYTRSQMITDDIKHCQTLLDDEKYNEVEECLNQLECRIGQDDRDLMDLRNSLFFERN